MVLTQPEGKPQRPTLVSRADTMEQAGRRLLRLYLDRMLRHEKKPRTSWDVDAVHDMRVAIRRLRVVCRVFGKTFGNKALTPYLRVLKRTGRVLGRVRDLDVFLDFVETYEKEYGGSVGLDAARARLQHDLEAPRTRLWRYLHTSIWHTFHREFHAWIGDTDVARRAGQERVADAGPRLLTRRCAKVLAYEEVLRLEPSPEMLHALRIECKRFRYTLEFFRECAPDGFLSLIERITTLQDLLGRIHDADVHIAFLTGFSGARDRRSSRARRIQVDLHTLILSEDQARQTALERFWPLWIQTLSVLQDRPLTFDPLPAHVPTPQE